LEADLPPGHPDLQRARYDLILTLARLCDTEQRQRQIARLARGTIERLGRYGEALAPRELETVAIAEERHISPVLSDDSTLRSDNSLSFGFELVETTRAVALSNRRVNRRLARGFGDGSVDSLLAKISKASRELTRRSNSGVEQPELLDALRRKETAQRQLQARLTNLAKKAGAAPRTKGRAVASSLSDDQAAIGYWRYDKWESDAERQTVGLTPSYLAYVLRHDGSLNRVELGPAAEVEAAAVAWRSALAPVGGRGIETARTPGPVNSAGVRLRELVIDPLRFHLDGATTWIVAPVDALFSIPLDALPDDGGVLGQHARIVYRSTLKELTVEGSVPLADPSLLVLGGIDYDHYQLGDESAGGANRSSPPRVASAFALRSAGWSPQFRFLDSSGPEAKAVRDYFLRAYGESAPLRFASGASATREFFEQHAPRSRILHLATHAYFAPESIPSTRDYNIAPGSEVSAVTDDRLGRVTGYAPGVLCGLAFAGANGRTEHDRRAPAVMTAEELSALDLTSCELAVLSACETNVGAEPDRVWPPCSKRCNPRA